MSDYQYVAWFRDHAMRPNDEDAEWPACFVIVATDGPAAQAWGDRLAIDYSRRHWGCEFLRSYLDTGRWEKGQVPRVAVGEDPQDEVMGW